MNKIKQLFPGQPRPSFKLPDSRNNSLDTGSSMATVETDATCNTGGECSSIEFPDCPFAGHKLYAPVAELFRHSLGLIYLARNRETGQKSVIKLIDRGPSITRTVAAELLLHRRCAAHPFMTHLMDVFLTPRHLAIVLEHIPGGDLLEYVNARGGLPENEARALFQQLVVATAFLHSLGASNREMKLEDKFLAFPNGDNAIDGAALHQNGAVVVGGSGGGGGDISSATTAVSAAATTATPAAGFPPVLKMQGFFYSKSDQINSDPQSALGSLPYTAPEVLSNSLVEGCASDVWALGVALFKVVTSLFPFERPEDASEPRRSVQNVLARIAHVDYVLPDHLSPELQDLLSRMIVREPSKRLSMEGITCHPWFTRDLPLNIAEVNAAAAANVEAAAPMTEAALQAVVEEAQLSLRSLGTDNIDDMADEILNEEEADDLLDELSLG